MTTATVDDRVTTMTAIAAAAPAAAVERHTQRKVVLRVGAAILP